MEKEKEILFKPLTDGLGFHPFADGMPYAPLSQTSQNLASGSGAVSAGRPTFAYPNPAAPPRVQVPVATPSLPVAPKLPSRPLHSPMQSSVAAPSISSRIEVRHYGMFYLVKRVLAYGADAVLNLSLCAGALSLALWKQNLEPVLLVNPGVVMVSSLFFLVFHWAILTSQEIAFGTSFGKRLFGLALQGSTAAIFLRSFFFFASVAFGGLGLLWSLFDGRRRCWHDLIVDLQPIEIARL